MRFDPGYLVHETVKKERIKEKEKLFWILNSLVLQIACIGIYHMEIERDDSKFTKAIEIYIIHHACFYTRSL